jgi:hypothetical protein
MKPSLQLYLNKTISEDCKDGSDIKQRSRWCALESKMAFKFSSKAANPHQQQLLQQLQQQ